MIRFESNASPWLLGAAALVCLGPLTLLWLAGTLAIATFAFHHHDVPAAIFVPTLMGTLGPIALALILDRVFSGRRTGSALFTVLAVIFGGIALLQIAELVTPWFAIEWRVLMLNSVLPCLACAYFALSPVKIPTPT